MQYRLFAREERIKAARVFKMNLPGSYKCLELFALSPLWRVLFQSKGSCGVGNRTILMKPGIQPSFVLVSSSYIT